MMRNNIKIAITGGIGCGKTSVCDIIRERGFSVISCDDVYSELLNSREFLSLITNEFGNVIKSDGSLDRKKLAEIVFKDRDSKKKLDKITHPAIMKEVLLRANAFDICFCEVPLLFENGFEGLFDNVIVILREKEERISSIQKIYKIDRYNAILRIKSQINYDKFNFAKYYVIHNDGNLENLRVKTEDILKKII